MDEIEAQVLGEVTAYDINSILHDIFALGYMSCEKGLEPGEALKTNVNYIDLRAGEIIKICSELWADIFTKQFTGED